VHKTKTIYRNNLHIEKVICLNILFSPTEKRKQEGKKIKNRFMKMKLNRYRKRIEREGEGRGGIR